MKSKAPSPAYTMCRIRLRMKIQRRPKMIRTIKQTNSTPEHEVKSYLVCRRETNGHQRHIRQIHNEIYTKYTQTYNSADTNLQREEDYCKAHNGCDTHCHHHWVSVMEAGNHSHHVGHTEGQDGLKNGKDKYQQLWGVCKDSSQVIKWQNTLKILSY